MWHLLLGVMTIINDKNFINQSTDLLNNNNKYHDFRVVSVIFVHSAIVLNCGRLLSTCLLDLILDT